jgi:nucleoside-diphosphate-sugar epimerase
MRVLFTGSSSFTGLWFIRALADAGHMVVATYQGELESYEGIRRERVDAACDVCEQRFGYSFGDSSFLALLTDDPPFDVLCHHAADVRDYRSPEFDVIGALANNTRRMPDVLRALRSAGGASVVVTGSFFEPDEGAGSEGLPAFSAYGVSKALTAQVVRYFAAHADLGFGKFVIPHPFGPLEDPSRLTSFLARSWLGGEAPTVRTPVYVRDNIHVSLLARAYARFVERAVRERGEHKLNPSGYPESMGAFVDRYAEAFRRHSGLPCHFSTDRQREFLEPRVRINGDLLVAEELGWSEEDAWVDLVAFHVARQPAHGGSG